MGERRGVYRGLVGKPEGKCSLGRSRRGLENLLEVGCRDMDWIGLAQDRYSWQALVNVVMNLRFP
jgi:hypothetical protein